ncbi:MAG: hypothetical protein ABSA53_35615 [Streptosporangiaceae bacterium]
MSKYDPLRDYLASRPEDVRELLMSFEQVEELVGRLPRSAYVHRAWWANTDDARVAALAWRSAGWNVKSVDQANTQVAFARNAPDKISPTAQEISLTQSAVTSAGTTSETDELIPEPPDTSGGELPEEDSRPGNPLSRRALMSDVAAAVVAAAAAGVIQLVGLTHLPWLALILLVTAVAAAAFTMTQAIVARGHADSARLWWSVSTLLVLILSAAAFTYHELFDPATHAPRTYQFVVNGNDANFIQLFGEAGGQPALLETGEAGQNGLIGGISYTFDCWTIGLDGAEWLRYERFGETWWAPRKYLHPPFGEPEPQVPHC